MDINSLLALLKNLPPDVVALLKEGGLAGLKASVNYVVDNFGTLTSLQSQPVLANIVLFGLNALKNWLNNPAAPLQAEDFKLIAQMLNDYQAGKEVTFPAS